MEIKLESKEWFVEHSDHECGPCTACCTWLGIEELQKHTGDKCKHLRSPVYANKRCSIYASRPKACSGYQCLWRVGWGPKYLRPHESGILVSTYNEHENEEELSLTVTVFDIDKAKSHIDNILASLLTNPFTVEVRVIYIKLKAALLYKNGNVYACRLTPPDGFESLNFEALEIPISTYRIGENQN